MSAAIFHLHLPGDQTAEENRSAGGFYLLRNLLSAVCYASEPVEVEATHS